MKGDFSRLLANDTYIMTLMQQGRVQLDSDWNAEVIQQWMYLKSMTAAILGEHGGPADSTDAGGNERASFKITEKSATDFFIGEGAYFVHGEMCVNPQGCSYLAQPFLRDPVPLGTVLDNNAIGAVYLKVWMRHVTCIEDPLIREVALGGPDTTTRVQRVWQVMIAPTTGITDNNFGIAAGEIMENYGDFEKYVPLVKTVPSGKLRARVEKMIESDDPCVLPPEAGYRGVENQLYRVEILYSGNACNQETDEDPDPNNDVPPEGKAVFVWSRDNGSVVYPIEDPKSEVITLKTLWRDDRYAIHVGDWVEISDEVSVLQRTSLPLRRVVAVDTELMQITLSKAPWWDERNLNEIPLENPVIRRWDHAGDAAWGGGIPVEECTLDENGEIEKEHWIDLEKGIQICFVPRTDESGNPVEYQYGNNDWWLIPARTATGDIEWPSSDEDPEKPAAMAPMQDGCWLAPLALIRETGNQNAPHLEIQDTRRQFIKMWQSGNGS